MSQSVRINSEVLPLNRELHADELDGKRGFSRQEALALDYVYEQFGDPFADGTEDVGLLTYMENRLDHYYQALVRARPRPQMVYIDFSPFKKYYDDKFQVRQGLTYPQWQEKFLAKLRAHFVAEEGPFNIDFVTRDPGVPCIHMFFSPEDVYDAIAKRPDTEKLIFMRNVKSSYPENIGPSLRRLKKENPHLDEETLLLEAFQDPFVRKIDNEGRGLTVNPEGWEAEFGNIHDESLIVIQGYHCGNFDVEQVVATAAHEIGHALGLKHPLEALDSYSKKSLVEDKKHFCHVMNPYPYRKIGGGICNYFNDYAVDYFRYILGIKTQ